VNRLLEDPVARETAAARALARSRRYTASAMGSAYQAAMTTIVPAAVP